MLNQLEADEMEAKRMESYEKLKNISPKTFEEGDINEILRGEISASEAYQNIMEYFKNDPESRRLEGFKMDHDEAITYWKKEARVTGKVPASDSSLWGSVVEAFLNVSHLFGDKASLIALKTGEEHGLEKYCEMLESKELTFEQKQKIRKYFIPKQQNHIRTIEALIKLQ